MFYKIFFTLLCSSLSLHAQELRWKWDSLNTSDISFPKDFMWGVAVSEYQVSGAGTCTNSNWSAWEQKKRKKIDQSGKACDSWHRMDEDVACAQKLGVKALRFSVEWCLIEPEEGMFDQEALQHYVDFCDKLLAAGIKPVVTLHHFTHPLWFEQKGAFERAENINYFVRFAEAVFHKLNDKVALWCTINEPGVYAFQGYIRGVWPPGRVAWPRLSNITRAGVVLKNLLRAHVLTYKRLKSLPGGEKSQIGIVHNIVQFEPYYRWNLVDRFIAWYLNHIFHQAIFNFLKTGNFRFYVPLPGKMAYRDPQAPQSYDFIGLNYYSHMLVKNCGPTCRPCEIKTDMAYAMYPEGFYRAIKQVAQLKVPIYITENGAPDKRDNQRGLFIQRYLYALSCACKEGCDVRGYFYWSLFDNYEWDLGYSQKFGLYHIDFDTFKRTLRDGAYYYIDIVRAYALRQFPQQSAASA